MFKNAIALNQQHRELGSTFFIVMNEHHLTILECVCRFQNVNYGLIMLSLQPPYGIIRLEHFRSYKLTSGTLAINSMS